ncbi:hypothetical protein MKW92_002456 [Papaver armeniacum]|nr:hypothetical protein MKW92_002456 [Papaver armeniacum]
MGISHLPDEIDKLIHLRYLDLSHNEELYRLADTVGRLINLRTLKLKNCQGLHQLPADMVGMLLKYLPKGIGKWDDLQTLSTFVISDACKGCKIEELKCQNLLKDRLGLERLKATEEAAEAELNKKSQLSELLLDFKPRDGTWLGQREGGVLKESSEDVLAISVMRVLQPHSNLKDLTVYNYLGFEFPSWMSSNEALRNLCCLDLHYCINWEELPTLGMLPSLEVLRISQLLNLKRIGEDIYGGIQSITQPAFPKLRMLHIYAATNLKVWEFGYKQYLVGAIMPCVTNIYLNECRSLIALPPLSILPSLQTLSIFESDQLVSFSSHSRLRGFPKLNSLTFFGLTNLEEFKYLGEMPCLQILDIKRCPKLTSLRFRTKSLPSLETLYFVELTNLKEFLVGEKAEEGEEEENLQLPHLLKVQIAGCNNLRSFPRHRLIKESLGLI